MSNSVGNGVTSAFVTPPPTRPDPTHYVVQVVCGSVVKENLIHSAVTRGKVCNRCLTRKPLDEFYANRKAKDGRQSCCKECRRKYLKANAERVSEVNRDYKKRAGLVGPGRRRLPSEVSGSKLFRKYGITQADYDRMLASQNGGCAICGAAPNPELAHAVDHCHESGRIRGLLCRPCNLGVGLFSDDPARLVRAAEYLGRGDE